MRKLTCCFHSDFLVELHLGFIASHDRNAFTYLCKVKKVPAYPRQDKTRQDRLFLRVLNYGLSFISFVLPSTTVIAQSGVQILQKALSSKFNQSRGEILLTSCQKFEVRELDPYRIRATIQKIPLFTNLMPPNSR
jgi:hypothetical protein